MYRDILTNRWVLGGVGFLIVFAVGCYFWYQHDIAADRKAAAEAKELLRQSEIAKKVADTDSEAEQAAGVSTENSTLTAEKPITDTTSATDKTKLSQVENPAQNTETTEVPVSPYGFGPYPKVPDEYFHFFEEEPDPNFWTYDWGKNGELMQRVILKLWEQGKQTHGGKLSNGLFYPTYPNTLIVKWKTQVTPFGIRRYVSRMQGSPETESWQRSHEGTIYESDIPSHFTVIEHKDAGIDPYQFLDLPRR